MTNKRVHVDLRKSHYKAILTLLGDKQSISSLIRAALKEYIQRRNEKI